MNQPGWKFKIGPSDQFGIYKLIITFKKKTGKEHKNAYAMIF